MFFAKARSSSYYDSRPVLNNPEEPSYRRGEMQYHSRAIGHHDAPQVDHLTSSIEQAQAVEEETDACQTVLTSDIVDCQSRQQAAPEDETADRPGKRSSAQQVLVESSIHENFPAEETAVPGSERAAASKYIEKSRGETREASGAQDITNKKTNTKKKKGKRTISQNSQPDISQSEPPSHSATKRIDASQDFPPLSSPVRNQRAREMRSSDHTSSTTTKSFAQAASRSVVSPGDGASDANKSGSSQDSSGKEQAKRYDANSQYQTKQGPTELGPGSPDLALIKTDVSSTKGAPQDESKSSVLVMGQNSPGRCDIVVPVDSKSAVQEILQHFNSQPMTRDVSTDITFSTTPAPGLSTGITTDTHTSPRNSFEQGEDMTGKDGVVMKSDTGIDEEYLWSRLEGVVDTSKSASSESGDGEHLSAKSADQRVSETPAKDVSLVENDAPISTAAAAGPDSRPRSPSLPEISVKQKGPTPPPPEPISTHKKKTRSKPATPTKKTFHSTSRSTQNQKQPASLSPSVERDKYPSIQVSNVLFQHNIILCSGRLEANTHYRVT